MKVCSLLFSLLFSLLSFSQTKIGEINNGGSFVAELNYEISGKDTVYTLMFTNSKYSSINDIQAIRFQEQGGTLNSFFQKLLESINADTEKDNNFTLGDEDIVIKKKPKGKFIYITTVENGAYFQLTKKDICKLFNKKDS